MQDMLKLNEIISYYKYENGKQPMYFQKSNFELKLNSDIHNHNTRNKHNLHIVRTNHKYAKKCLNSVNLPLTSNSVPLNICNKIQTHGLQRIGNDIKHQF